MTATHVGVPEGELAPRFWARLRVFAARRLGDAAAEDVAQETLRRVAQALRSGRLQHPDALPAFVFQTARHICLHMQRSASREAKALARAAAQEDQESGPTTADDPLTALISHERRMAVRRALEALDPDDAGLLRLAYFDQLSADEIAGRYGATAGAIRVRKHRALRRLADRLAEHSSNTGVTSGTQSQ